MPRRIKRLQNRFASLSSGRASLCSNIVGLTTGMMYGRIEEDDIPYLYPPQTFFLRSALWCSNGPKKYRQPRYIVERNLCSVTLVFDQECFSQHVGCVFAIFSNDVLLPCIQRISWYIHFGELWRYQDERVVSLYLYFRMKKLSPRLYELTKWFLNDHTLIDIGCDHGWLPILAIQNGWVTSAIAVDRVLRHWHLLPNTEEKLTVFKWFCLTVLMM